MNKIYLIFLIVCCTIQLNAQDRCNYDSILLTIELNQDTVFTLAPMYYSMSMTNMSKEQRKIMKLWMDNVALPMLQYRKENDTIWHSLELSEAGMYGYNLHTFITSVNLEPNQKITIESEWLDIPFQNSSEIPFISSDENQLVKSENLFSKPGIYHLRLYSNIGEHYCKKKIISSNTVQLVVKEHKGINKEAKDWLVNNTLHPSFIYQSLLRKGRVFGYYDWKIYDQQQYVAKEKIEEFIELYPNSTFTVWAKLYLAQWYFKGYKIVNGSRKKYLSEKNRSDRKELEFLEVLEKANTIINDLISNEEHLFDKEFEAMVLKLQSQIKRGIYVIKAREYSRRRVEEYKKQLKN